MGLQNYGVWKATPTSFKAQRAKEDSKSPHGYLVFQDGTSTAPKLEAAINVKSLSEDSRLVYWISENFTHAICQRVKALPEGWHGIEGSDAEKAKPDSEKTIIDSAKAILGSEKTSVGSKKTSSASKKNNVGSSKTNSDSDKISLDLIRDGLVDVKDGKVVPHNLEGANNDIVDFIEPFFEKAIQEQATVYIWGEQYDGQDGVHDVHMNQGSSGKFADQNGPNQDGGIVVEFSDGHWGAFFIAFASQTAQTTAAGEPSGDTFAVFLDSAPTTGDVNAPPTPGDSDTTPAPGDSGNKQPPAPKSDAPIRIIAALVNPEGRDNVDNPEKVYLKNTTGGNISLSGWAIENHLGHSFTLPQGLTVGEGEEEEFEVPGVPLSNKGGSIGLKDAEGKVVDQVEYTKEQAHRKGEVIRFD